MNNSLILIIMIRILGHFSKHIDANQTDLFIIISDWFSELNVRKEWMNHSDWNYDHFSSVQWRDPDPVCKSDWLIQESDWFDHEFEFYWMTDLVANDGIHF